MSGGKKRKRAEVTSGSVATGTAKKNKSCGTQPTSSSLLTQSRILELEETIISSPRNYNDLVPLLSCLQDFTDPALAVTAAVSLCRTFCRLLSLGRMTKRKNDTEAEQTLLAWLKERYKEYVKELELLMGSGDLSYQSTALTLMMRLVKEEGTHLTVPGNDYYFPHDLMARIVKAVLYLDVTGGVPLRDEFVTKWLDAYHDVRYSFMFVTLTLVEEASSLPSLPTFRSNLLSIMLSMENLPKDINDYTLSPLYVLDPQIGKTKVSKVPKVLSPSSHRAQIAALWVAILDLSLSPGETRTVLEQMTHSIVPYFSRPQLLFDFLTDAYNSGGVVSILAINGVYELIKVKNLDYPMFYNKLYALFDRSLMHMRYRSRFFRLVGIFLSSTHLPATLVASFIKRMARLAITAPPAAIVTIVPLVYNLLKAHPTCTFMIHREHYDREQARKEGYVDPYDESEPDPLKTGAIESCLWELEMLQTHYHPSVATLCRIISEQFTKQSYKLEEFLDHSYTSMIDAELKKTIKKDPVVEYIIPKRIFTIAPDSNNSLSANENNKSESSANPTNPTHADGDTLVALWAF